MECLMNDVPLCAVVARAGFRSSLHLLIRSICSIIIFSAGTAWTLPQFAAMKGLTCIACHVTSQGGGLRTTRGWRESKSAALLQPKTLGLGGLYAYDGSSNSLFDGRLIIGGDFRMQSARSHKSKDSNRRLFPMQASLSSAYKIAESLTVEGSYNFGPKKFLGQQKWSGSVMFTPRSGIGQIRAGFFHPSIGVRYDDHTMIIDQIGGAELTSLIPVNYAEYGGELTYSGLRWIQVTAGIFDAGNFAENRILDTYGTEMSLIKDTGRPSYLGRIDIFKRAMFDILNASAGISYLDNDDFSLTNVFASAGLFERIALIAEYAGSDKKDLRMTDNGAIDLSYRAASGLMLYARGERGVTKSTFGDFTVDSHTNQGVFGAQIFILPYIELRPEYRIVDTERYRSTRYAVQLHVYR